MVTMAQINRLDSRITELVARLNPEPRIVYEVQLCWMQPDGSVLDGDGNPVVRQPGAIVLMFDDPIRLHQAEG
jgi:hypothetical protein